MNRKEYLDQLAKDLGSMPYSEVNEIVAEISEHFDMAAAAGKTEAQAADDLGDVHELAKSYINCTPYKLPVALREKQETNKVSKGTKAFLIIFNIIVALPLTVLWGFVDISIVLTIVRKLIAFVVKFTVMGKSGEYLLSMWLWQGSTFFSIIFLGCALYFGIALLIRVAKKYLRWNRKVWTKGM